MGSHASGGATADSDVDLAVVGEGPHYRLEVHDGVLVSLGWDRRGEEWTSGLCAQVEPSELESLPAAGRIDDRAAAHPPDQGGFDSAAGLVVIAAAACAGTVGLVRTVRRRSRPDASG